MSYRQSLRESVGIQQPNFFEERFDRLARIAKLHPRWRNVLQLRYMPGYEYTFKETARTLGVTKERVAQIEVAALHRLKRAALVTIPHVADSYRASASPHSETGEPKH
jgi:DNA-directed RNA polymerase sigma subunit (sigma70/sigma32)